MASTKLKSPLIIKPKIIGNAILIKNGAIGAVNIGDINSFCDTESMALNNKDCIRLVL
jgi:hypothetical protein